MTIITYFIKQDLRGEIKRAASFFNKSLSENELDVLEDHLDFKNFKNNESANWEYFRKSGSFEGDFMRKGKIRYLLAHNYLAMYTNNSFF